MAQIISAFPIMMYLAFTDLVSKIKKDERGLSGVVVAILLILIAVLAIVLIWGFLGDWLSDLWTRITGQSSSIS